MDKGAVGWLVKTAGENFWRVEGFMTRDDLVQEGYICYFKVAGRYKKTATGKAHLMSLFKTTYLNRITDLANERRKHIHAVSLEAEHLEIPLNESRPFLWEGAPFLIQQLFDAVHEHPHRANWKPKVRNGKTETTAEWLGRIMGGVTLPPEFHLEVRAYVLANS